MLELGNKLRKLRTENKITLKQVSERIGIVPSAISSYETGDKEPSLSSLISLSKIYHVSVDYLLGTDNVRRLDIDGLNDEETAALNHFAELLRKKKE